MPISRPTSRQPSGQKSFSSTSLTPPSTAGRGRPHQSVLAKAHEEPERITPCRYDPERWHPDEQKPDPTAVAACWSCHFQSQCAARALANKESFGIWGGYRLAPGPGLVRSRLQLAIVAGVEIGPPASPGSETLAVLSAAASASESANAAARDSAAERDSAEPSAQVISLADRQPHATLDPRPQVPTRHTASQIRAHAG